MVTLLQNFKDKLKLKQRYDYALNKVLEMRYSKKGYSTGFTWVFGIVSLFGLGILYIVFDQVFEAHLVPTITQIVDDSALIDAATKTEITGNIQKYMDFFSALPFILFCVVILYMIVAAVRKEGESEFV